MQLTNILTGFPATIQGVSTQNMNQGQINWNMGTWKVHSSSKCVNFRLLFRSCSVFYFLQVYKAIFTSPSSARDISEKEDNTENMPPAKLQRTLSGKKPARHNVASKVNLNDKVTPRSIAYAAVQVGFALLRIVLCLFLAASSISICKLQVHGPNFMEDLTTKDCTTTSLISSKIPLGLQRRSVPKIYLPGGWREYLSSYKEYSIKQWPR